MPAATLLDRFKSWFNAEEDDEEMDMMDTTPQPTSVPTAPPAPRRQRGPLTLHGQSEGGMEIRHPRNLEDRKVIGMDLKQRRLVTLDLTGLPEADQRYFLEFVCGVVFALDATAEKVTEGIYMLAPRGVSVHNDTEAEDTVTTSYTSAAAPTYRAAGRASSGNSEQEELFWQAR